MSPYLESLLIVLIKRLSTLVELLSVIALFVVIYGVCVVGYNFIHSDLKPEISEIK